MIHTPDSTTEETAAYLTTKHKAIDIFNDRHDYLNPSRLFYAYFDKVPTIITLYKMDCRNARKWIEAQLKGSIIHTHTDGQYSRKKCRVTYSTIIYVLHNELIVSIKNDKVEIVYACGNKLAATQLVEKVKRFSIKKKRSDNIHIILAGSYSLSTFPVNIKKPLLQIGTHYNDDLELLHPKIIAHLKKENTRGLFLFYGTPGTGKSTYIRYLIFHLKKKVVFMTPRQAASLENPEFGSFILDHSNTVIIIEDAEELIESRKGHGNFGISTLLNLSDGLLAETLGIQVIASFNTNIALVDKALLRKGRLTALYEFKELSAPKAATLATALGFTGYTITKPMALADIYNIQETSFQIKPERNAIGFMTNNN
jgi:pantothenate kinase-related protein Tda10